MPPFMAEYESPDHGAATGTSDRSPRRPTPICYDEHVMRMAT
jgi:hypothetical protein